MAFAQFDDLSGHGEVIIFPRLYKKVEAWLSEYDVFLIKGTLDITSTNKCKIKANELVPIELFFKHWKTIDSCTLTLPQTFDQTTIDHLNTIIKHGKTVLKFIVYENGKKLLLQTRKKILCDEPSIENIRKNGIEISLQL